MTPRALVSVHDVMPTTFAKVKKILGLLDREGVPPPTLLVVPGKDWTRELVGELKTLSSQGYPLAGHGWNHRAAPTGRTFYHRIHASLISRNEAEHLSRPPGQLAELIRHCHRWFAEVGLPSPELYVPPAWALGALKTKDLAALPFRWIEVLRGFREIGTGRTRWLPLAGFEADTTFRKLSLRLWNGLNRGVARTVGSPLRISIHPQDLDLLMADDLRRFLSHRWEFVREEEVFRKSSSTQE